MPGAYVLVLEDKQAFGKSEQDNRPTPAIGRQKAVTTFIEIEASNNTIN